MPAKEPHDMIGHNNNNQNNSSSNNSSVILIITVNTEAVTARTITTEMACVIAAGEHTEGSMLHSTYLLVLYYQ